MLDQKADLHAAKQSARRVYSKGERLRILELYSLGNLALEIQALLPEKAAGEEKKKVGEEKKKAAASKPTAEQPQQALDQRARLGHFRKK